MEKKRNNLLKRVAAGALSVLTVAAYTMPADVVGKFSGNIGIVAQAAEVSETFATNQMLSTYESDNIKITVSKNMLIYVFDDYERKFKHYKN